MIRHQAPDPAGGICHGWQGRPGSWLCGLLFLMAGLLCGPAPLAAASVPAEYEIVDPGAGSTVEALVAGLKGGAALQDCPPGGSGFGCVLRDGRLIDFGALAGLELVRPAVSNAQGWVAGYGVAGGIRGVIERLQRWYFLHFVARLEDDFLRYVFPPRTAFVHDGKTLHRVAGLGGTDTTVAAINASGEVAGRSETRRGEFHAYVHRAGRSIDLGTLGGGSSRAHDLNDSGEVVGVAENAAGHRRAFLHRHGCISDLGTLGGAMSGAWAIDNAGSIVGYSTTATGEMRAFLYRDGGMSDLNALVAPSPFGVLEAAHFIADSGDIVASARAACGEVRVLLLRRSVPER